MNKATEMKSWVCRNCGEGIVSNEPPICAACLEPMLNSGYRVESDMEKAQNLIEYMEAELAGMAAKCETIRRIYANRVKQLGRACREYKTKAETLREVVGQLQTKLQPGGSPPPGGDLTLALWIINSACAELTGLRAAPWMDYAAVIHAVRSAYIEGAGDFYRGESFNKERDIDEWWLDSDSKRRLGPGPKGEV